MFRTFSNSCHPDQCTSCPIVLLIHTSLPPPSSQDSDHLPLFALLPPYPSHDSSAPLPSPLPTSQTSLPARLKTGFLPAIPVQAVSFRNLLSLQPSSLSMRLLDRRALFRSRLPFQCQTSPKLRSDLAVFWQTQQSLQRSLNISLTPVTSPGETFILSFLHVPTWEREAISGPRHRSMGTT